jgi:HK97 family phage prohead protease
MQQKELRRSVRANTLDIRANTDGTTTVGGYAAVYESASQPLPFTEILRRGAFKNTLADGDEKFFIFGHDMNQPLARESNGSLKLSEDSKGLKFAATVNDSPRSQQLIADLRSGLITDMSFGFYVDESAGDRDSWTQDSKGNITRYIDSCTLVEISAVLEGAYPAASISLALRSCPAGIRAKLKRDAGDAQEVTDCSCYDPDAEPDADCDCDPRNDSDRSFSPCTECRSALCTRCQSNFRSVRTAVDSTGLPVRAGLCVRCVRSLCDRCADAYAEAIGNGGDVDASSRRRLASLMLRLAAN